MISKTSIVIMGLLSEEKLSAYDMLKRIEHMNMKYWWPIGDTTLYETVLRLEKKKYLKGTSNGNKCIYELTESGHILLIESLRRIFLRMDYDTTWMSIAVLFNKVFSLEQLEELILKRNKLLSEFCLGIEKNQILHSNQPNIPIEADLTVERMRKIAELEKHLLDQLEETLLNEDCKEKRYE